MANRYWNGLSTNWNTVLTTGWCAAAPIAFTASCSGTALTTVGSPALVVGMTVVSNTGLNLGTISSGSGNSWVVTTGGTYASQTMTAATAGASVPTSADDVFFTSPNTYSVNMVNALACKNWTVSAGTVTFTNGTTPTLAISGNIDWTGATVSAAFSFAVTLTGAGAKTINTAGQTLGGNPINLQTSGASYTLAAAFVTTANISMGAGVTFDTAGYAFTGSGTSGISVGSGILTLGTSLCTFTNTGCIGGTGNSSATISAASSSIVNSSNSAVTLISSGYPAVTFGSVSFTAASNTSITINQANTFGTLSFAGRTTLGITPITFNADQNITTLTLNAGTAAAYRTFLASDTIGTTRTLTVGTLTAGAADYDFRDITIAGAAAPISVTRAGDCKGNSGITFPAAKTVYWRTTGSANWNVSASGWSLTNGGALDATAFPLAQDTAVFPSSPTAYPTSGNTITINANYNIGTIDMQNRTSATMTLATGTTTPAIYGNWINGTGTTITGTGRITFTGRGSQTLTSSGKSFSQLFTINTPGGSFTLQDALTMTGASGGICTLTAGTFDASTYNVTFSNSGFQSTNSNTRAIALGPGTWTMGGTGVVWTTAISTNLTLTGSGTLTLTNAGAKTFAGGDIQTYPTLNQGGTGALTVTGSNKFANITNTAIGSVLFTSGTTNEFTSFNLNGASGNLLTLGATTTSQATLKKPSTWYMGANSTNAGNNTGLTFTAGGGIDYLSVSYINGQVVSVGSTGNFLALF